MVNAQVRGQRWLEKDHINSVNLRFLLNFCASHVMVQGCLLSSTCTLSASIAQISLYVTQTFDPLNQPGSLESTTKQKPRWPPPQVTTHHRANMLKYPFTLSFTPNVSLEGNSHIPQMFSHSQMQYKRPKPNQQQYSPTNKMNMSKDKHLDCKNVCMKCGCSVRVYVCMEDLTLGERCHWCRFMGVLEGVPIVCNWKMRGVAAVGGRSLEDEIINHYYILYEFLFARHDFDKCISAFCAPFLLFLHPVAI